jgi:DNA-binding GntR family transcriptional regulator
MSRREPVVHGLSPARSWSVRLSPPGKTYLDPPGIGVVPTSPQARSKRWDHGLRRQVLVDSLLKEIVNGQIQPGQHLVTQALARRFDVSHTPVREALIMLAGMGLVDVAPNRGAIVRQLTPREVREVCQVRRALECEAVRLACGRLHRDDLQSIQADLQRMIAVESPDQHHFIAEARAVDSRLHDLIAGRCGNTFLARELSRLKNLFRAFRDVAWDRSEARNDYHRLDAEAREHLTIVEALLACDRPRAVRAMARHIHSGMTYWCRALPDHPAAPGHRNGTAQVRVEGKP